MTSKLKAALTTPRHINATRLLTGTLGATVVATQTTDALSTNLALALGAVEMNPVMDALIHATTPGQFVAAKAAIGLAIAVAFRSKTELLAVLSAVFAGVTVWNLYWVGVMLAAA